MKQCLAIALVLLFGWTYGQEGFRGIRLGTSVNSEYDELMPRFSADGNRLYFSRGEWQDRQLLMESKQLARGDWSTAQFPGELFRQGTITRTDLHQFVGHIDARGTLWLGNNHLGYGEASLVQIGDAPQQIPLTYKNMAPESFSFAVAPDEQTMVLAYATKMGSQDLYVLFRAPGQPHSWTAPRPLGRVINTRGDEVAPFIGPDGKTLFFTSDGHDGQLGGGDIYFSRRLDDTWEQWSEPVHLGPAVNTAGWDGHFVLHPNGLDAYFVSGPTPESLGDIYRIALEDLPVLAPKMPRDTVTVVARDGQAEAFSLLRFGIPDRSAPLLEVVARDGSGEILLAANAPHLQYQPAEDFRGKETFVLRSCDPPRSSNCREVVVQATAATSLPPGDGPPVVLRYVTPQGTPLPIDLPPALVGNVDVQRMQQANGRLKWNNETESEYLRYDPGPDFVGLDTLTAHRLDGRPPALVIVEVVGGTQPVDTVAVEPTPADFLLFGAVRIEGESEAPGGVEIRLLEENGKDLGPLPLKLDGSYQIRLPADRNYLLRSESGLYYPYAASVTARPPEVEQDIVLAPIPADTGTVFTLKNVYFDVGKATLRPESTAELKRLYQLLRENPSMEVEIRGHTDNQDTEASNQTLSEARVQSVINYLKYQGIQGRRLTGKGFGESQPIDTNSTPEGRQNNRRVEVAVLKN